MGDKRHQRRAANWISGWVFDFNSLHGEMDLKHMWFTLTENSFNNWYNISRELKWLSLVTSSFQAISLHCWPTFILSCSSRNCSAGKAHWRKRCTCVSQKKRSFGCSHDNSLMSRFLPPSEPLEPVHLRKYVSKRKPEKLFKKWCIIYLYFFLLLAACGKTVLCETCSESVRPQQ